MTPAYPSLVSVTVNGGSPIEDSKSIVTHIRLVFSAAMALTPGLWKIRPHPGVNDLGSSVKPSRQSAEFPSLTSSEDRKTWDLGVNLADGVYDVIDPAGGVQLTFPQMFGSTFPYETPNYVGVFDDDTGELSAANGSHTGDSNFNPHLDRDGDGAIGTPDHDAFFARYGNEWQW